jgi:hypothetical protein
VRASGVHDVALECDGANSCVCVCVCVCVSKLNRIGAIRFLDPAHLFFN